MIDFRYHLVSIVSIFLALAVGIVLGAGPLKEDIGNTLTSEVTKLREDRAQLRTQLADADKSAQARDAFTEATNPTLLAGRLQGVTLTVVVLPGADGNLVKETTATLTGAGARIGSTVTVLDAWVDPDKQDLRAGLAEQLAPSLQLPAAQPSNDVLGAALARGLLAKDGGEGDAGAAVLERLRTAELVRHTPDEVTPASGAVVVGGPLPAGPEAERTARAAALTGLADALDAAGSGAVLLTPEADGADSAEQSLVVFARQDADVTDQLSTVDHADLPLGQASTVLALVEQLGGKAGQYGLEADATAAFPAVPAR